MPMQADLPPEISQHIFQYLEPKELGRAFFVCRSWNEAIDQRFLNTYMKTLNPTQITSIPPSAFKRFLSCFNKKQLFYLNGKTITRHFLHQIEENPTNVVNLRIAKLASSLSWFQEIVELHAETYIHHWDCKNDEYRKKFKESLAYIHLLILGTAYPSVLKLESQDETICLISHEAIKQLKWDDAFREISKIIKHDFYFFYQNESQNCEELLQTAFEKHEIKHIMDPRGKSNLLVLPNVIFKSLFPTVKIEHLQSEVPPIFIRCEGQPFDLEAFLNNPFLEVKQIQSYGNNGQLKSDPDKVTFILVELAKKMM